MLAWHSERGAVASATGTKSFAWASKALSAPAESTSAFQTVAAGAPSGPQPPAMTSPSETASADAPVRASGRLTPSAAAQVPRVFVSVSTLRAQTVAVGSPSAFEPPRR